MKPSIKKKNDMQVFERNESEVRSYCRSFPAKFERASGSTIWDVEGKAYLDFFAGAGALNYGHNPPEMKKRLLEYLAGDGISHTLDMASQAKEDFLTRFHEVILRPRGLNYKVMFPGPTGTNSVESALKLARKVTGRQTIMGFTNAFHGMTLGALAVTGNKFKRKGAGVPLHHAVSMPYDGYLGSDISTLDYIESYLKDSGSGISLPAAVIVETVQGEGGINVASSQWLKGLAAICKQFGMLLIVDDVQMGCGRTGPFFSFERCGIVPDIVCLSKSIGGYGLPMALTLIKPELDQWTPGEHNGTFRGNNLAFIAAAEAMSFWQNRQFEEEIGEKARLLSAELDGMTRELPDLKGERRGIGMMQGIAFERGVADRISRMAFERGLIMETSGTDSEVIKIMPPLTIELNEFKRGLALLKECLFELAEEKRTVLAN